MSKVILILLLSACQYKGEGNNIEIGVILKGGSSTVLPCPKLEEMVRNRKCYLKELVNE